MAIETSSFVGGDGEASDLAHHLYQAGAAADPEKTVRALALAGQVAMRTMAFDEALRHFENALSIELDDAPTRANLLHGLGLALRSLGRWEDALSAWREALTLLEGSGDPKGAGLMAYEMAHQLAWATRWAEATEVATRGLANLGDAPVPERAFLTLMSGIAFSLGGNGEFGRQLIDEGQALAERIGEEDLIGYGLYCRAVHHWAYGEAEACIEVGRRAAEVLRRAGDLWDLAALLGFMDFGLFLMGRFEECFATAEEAIELCRRLGHLGAELIPGRSLAFGRHFVQGHFDEFEAYIDRDIEICRTIGSPFIRDGLVWKGLIASLRGDPEAARPWYEGAAEEPRVPGIWAPIHPMFLARHLALTGEAERARGILDEHRRFLPAPEAGPVSFGSWLTLALTVETRLELGDAGAAAELYPLTLAYIATGAAGQAYDHRPIEFVAGLAAAAGGRWDEAEGHHVRALEVAATIDNRVAEVDIRRRLAEVYLGRAAPDDRERAGDQLTQAIALARALGMPKHAEIAERMLST